MERIQIKIQYTDTDLQQSYRLHNKNSSTIKIKILLFLGIAIILAGIIITTIKFNAGNPFWLGIIFIGLGIYVALDTRHNPIPGEDEASRLAGIITPTISYRFAESWLARFSWSRTVTDYNRDTDVLLVGIGYRF